MGRRSAVGFWHSVRSFRFPQAKGDNSAIVAKTSASPLFCHTFIADSANIGH